MTAPSCHARYDDPAGEIAVATTTVPVGHQVDADGQAATADVPDAARSIGAITGELAQVAQQPRTGDSRTGREVVVDQASEHHASGRRTDRVARGGEQGRRWRVVEHSRRTDGGRERQSAAQRLPERDQVGSDIVVLKGMEQARPAQTDFDLVAHDEHVIAAAGFHQLPQEPVGRNDEAAVGEDRLDRHAGDVARRQLDLEALQRVVDDGGGVPGVWAIGVRKGDEGTIRVGHGARIDVDTGDPHCHAKPAVITVFESDDTRLARRQATGP